ncbi:hypothetical protein SDC9_161886 [bioreactor metagenome]|uniref:Uncharacterized protein n=1 Tax=bioreactor metagenome TaxID=1076179 RepID=A0A645FMJ3_9ZZZZ
MLFRAAANDFVKVLLNPSVDDEDNLFEPGLHGVVEGIVHNDFAVLANGVDLLESAVATAHAGGHHDKSWFLHDLFAPCSL